MSERLAIDGGRPVRGERLPLHKPWFDQREESALRRVLAGTHVAGDGACGKELERLLCESTGARGALVVNSCTGALEIAMDVAGLGPGDEVILPSFTFVSTANAVLKAGARPVFADIDPRTFGLDPADVARRVTPRTRAVLPVHYAGMACDMKALEAIAVRHHLLVIEDAAHGVNATYGGRALGALGELGSLSFHETKDLVCGEGGALLVRDDEARIHAAEILREKGTDRTAFLRGERDKYTWVGLGSSYVLSELLAAVAVEQFKKLPEITRRKTAHAERLLSALAPYRALVQAPVVPDGCHPNWHVFAVLVAPARRDWALKALRAEGIGAAFHYVPLHSAPYAQQSAEIAPVDLPVTDRVAASLIRLPISAAFTDADCDDVIAASIKVFERMATLS
ncbi:MAG TPA: dTDP-4-amino-4,6-dideoxygalactose transaminase [Vicinamibacterales bacterium]|nr:dTDP-4-amino-4,6-dideoxygalactose transaminase [Vicinamibacterales bacterium]